MNITKLAEQALNDVKSSGCLDHCITLYEVSEDLIVNAINGEQIEEEFKPLVLDIIEEILTGKVIVEQMPETAGVYDSMLRLIKKHTEITPDAFEDLKSLISKYDDGVEVMLLKHANVIKPQDLVKIYTAQHLIFNFGVKGTETEHGYAIYENDIEKSEWIQELLGTEV